MKISYHGVLLFLRAPSTGAEKLPAMEVRMMEKENFNTKDLGAVSRKMPHSSKTNCCTSEEKK